MPFWILSNLASADISSPMSYRGPSTGHGGPFKWRKPSLTSLHPEGYLLKGPSLGPLRKKDLPAPAQLWGSQGLEPDSPTPLVTPIPPFLLSSHFCLSCVMASFSPADRFSMHGDGYGHCQCISSMESMPPPGCTGGGALEQSLYLGHREPWLAQLASLAQLCGLGGEKGAGWAPRKSEHGNMCWAHKAMATIPTLQTSHRGCSVQVKAYEHQHSVPGSQPLLHLSSPSGGGNKCPTDHYNAGCRVWQQRQARNAVRAQAGGLELNPHSQGEFLEEWQEPESPRTAGVSEAMREREAFQVNNSVKVWDCRSVPRASCSPGRRGPLMQGGAERERWTGLPNALAFAPAFPFCFPHSEMQLSLQTKL